MMNATLQFDYLLPWHLQESRYDYIRDFRKTDWINNEYGIYVQLKEGVDPAQTNAKIKNVIAAHQNKKASSTSLVQPEIFLHPMSKWKLYPNLKEVKMLEVLALVLALGIVALSLPYFNQLTKKTMYIDFMDPTFLGLTLAFTLFTGLLAGSYPAIYLSSFNPVKILKGGVRVGKTATLTRQVLVVLHGYQDERRS